MENRDQEIRPCVSCLYCIEELTSGKRIKCAVNPKVGREAEFDHLVKDGNGRVGRLLLFKECLRNKIVPFIITDEMKMFYYRGLHEGKSEPGFLVDTCLSAQDHFKKDLDYFKIPYIE